MTKQLSSHAECLEYYTKDYELIDVKDYGCIEGDCINGQGTIITYNGDKYIGFFQNDLKHGYGEYYWDYGGVFRGKFKQDQYTENGTFSWGKINKQSYE